MNYASMSAMRLLEVLNDLGEQDTLEAKSLHGDPARSVLETVNSFSNEIGLGGGVILIGVSESEQADGPNYVVDGVADPDKAQLDLATQCKTVFSTAVYPTIKVEKIGKKAVLKVVVDELPHSRKPIYFKKDGLPKGAYRRIGSADLVATDDDLGEFYRDPDDDFEAHPARHASVEDVDPMAIEKYREMRRKVDPQAVELSYKTKDLLSALNCVNPDDPRQLNMAGVLLFGKPHLIRRVCPRARVDYVRIPSNVWDASERLSGKDIYAPIFLMVDRLLSVVYAELPEERVFRSDRRHPEVRMFPIEVMREAIVNALMHTDYRRGPYTQIVRYNNRIEITNSGCSLKPDEALGTKGSVARNQTIANVCHDAKLAEAKGSGIGRMWRIMTDAGLSRPTMESSREEGTFTIRLLLHSFVDEGTSRWLANFADCPFNGNQRTALVFLREVGALDALSYRQLTGCAPKRVVREIAAIKAEGLVLRHGKSRGTYYIPTEKLLADVDSGRTVATTIPPAATTTPSAAITIPSAATTTPLPRDLVEELANLKGKTSAAILSGLVVRLCSCRPMTNEMLQTHLKRSKGTVNRIVTPLIGKRIAYLYPMMVHHPNQAYVAIPGQDRNSR